MSLSTTYCFLINCASNAYRAESLFEQKEKELSDRFPGSEFIYIRQNDSIQDIAAQKAQTYSHIIACGGDGTVNQVANGIIDTKAILGVIPLGSGNDFAQSIGLTGSFEQAMETLSGNSVSAIDAVSTDTGYFLNTLGIGVDGATNYYASKSMFRSGFLRYFFGGLKALMNSKPFDLSLKTDGNPVEITHKVWMVTLANGRNEGGRYTISPTSDHSDGVVEIIIVNPVSRYRLIMEFIKLSLGIPFKNGVIQIRKAKNLIELGVNPSQRVHADGEQLALFSQGKFEINASKIPVVIA
ncbi:diacylglycerol/lipid kinase family protein [Gracilimonas tropica]|uniref:diacylglycerol/lipid kinase family protein n=1 Tax=Gracilimonas tropica TaxID=454600 RepID=UPI000378B4A3|nr:YegS/Rv2252/BmrU family lipid kinase [Gracilimonas tropica]